MTDKNSSTLSKSSEKLLVFSAVTVLVWLLCATVKLVPWITTALSALMLSALLSTLINTLSVGIHKLTKLPKKLCSTLIFIAFISLFALTFFALGGKLVKEAEELLVGLSLYRADADAIVMKLTYSAADRLSLLLPFDVEGEHLSDLLVSASDDIISYAVSAVGKVAASALGASPKIFFAAVTFLTACFYMTLDYDTVRTALSSLIPGELKNSLPSFKADIFKVAKKCALAYLIFFLMTALIVWIGLVLLKSPYPLLMALTVAAVDLLPVFGAGAVLLPWSVLSFALGKPRFALGLIVVYGIVTVVRKIAEPKILGDGLGVHPLISLAFMTVGGLFFGFFGVLLSPLAAYLFCEFIKKRAKSKKM